MPLAVAPVFDPSSSRIVLSVTGAPATTSYLVVRRVVGGVTTTVRGAGTLSPDPSSTAQGIDYEFAAGVENTYRVSAYDTAGATVETSLPVVVVPDQPRMWLKSVGRPFLSRPVTLVDPGEAERKSRSTAFDIVGTRDAIAVNDQHGARSRTIRLLAPSLDETDALDLLTSLGDVLLVQMPPGAPFGTLYANAGDTTISPVERRGGRRYVTVPLTEVAAPDSTVAASSATWRTLPTAYATWSAVLSAHRNWQSVAQLIGSPTDIWVT